MGGLTLASDLTAVLTARSSEERLALVPVQRLTDQRPW
jgi:hypothetical protein